MMGISYGGISQLFVGATARRASRRSRRCRSSTTRRRRCTRAGSSTRASRSSWAKDRVHDARPASRTGGQPWALERIRKGDRTCKANQVLHAEAVDLLAKLRRNSFYDPKVADPLAPRTFVHRITSPVFLACQWTDEQTGGHCPTLAAALHGHHAQVVHVHERHAHRLARPGDVQPLVRLPVAVRRAPRARGWRRRCGAAPVVYKAAMGVDGVTLPDDPIQEQPTSPPRWPRSRRCRRCASCSRTAPAARPARPYPAFERSFASFPVPGTQRALVVPRAPAARSPTRRGRRRAPSTFTWDPTARPADELHRQHRRGPNGLWTATPLLPLDAATRPAPPLSYVTAPLGADTAVIGAGALEAWIRVVGARRRPPGHGLRGPARRQGDLRAERLAARQRAQAGPAKQHPARAGARACARADAAPLPRGPLAKVTIPLYYQGHVYRAGLADPRDDRARPAATSPSGRSASRGRDRHRARRARARADMPSRLVLPVVPGVDGADAAAALPGPARPAVPARIRGDARAARVVAGRDPGTAGPTSTSTRWCRRLWCRAATGAGAGRWAGDARRRRLPRHRSTSRPRRAGRGRARARGLPQRHAADTPHLSQSVGKSVLGLLVGTVRRIDRRRPSRARPGGRRQRLHGATVQHLLDMTAAIDFVEDYETFWRYDVACAWHPPHPCAPAETILENFPTIGPAGRRHGERLHYSTPNTDLLGLRRARGRGAAGRADRARAVGAARRAAGRAADGRQRGDAAIGGGFCATCATTRGSASSCAATAPGRPRRVGRAARRGRRGRVRPP